ncbi:MAG: DUF4263 domain-containing protein [Campylobacterales bacterium]|nr:DUF4263 domain-containing protein [Campylobacterales bacterium]
MPEFSLCSYQLEAFKSVINEYEQGEGDSALVIMPAGTGKTVIVTKIIDYLINKYKVKNIAYVSVTKALSIYINQTFEEKLQNKKCPFVTYTYSKLIDDVFNNNLNKNSFDIIIFDGFDEFTVTNENLLLYEKILTYFKCFKIAFSRDIHSELIRNFKLVYRYSYEDSIQDGSFIHIQKLLKENYIDHLDSIIKNLRDGELLSIEEKNLLQREIDTLKQENQEFQKALEMLLDKKLKKEELFEMSYRVEQLNIFEKMLASNDIEEKISEQKWQQFFEINQWIFGLGLNYIFNAALDGKKLEKTVVGANVSGSGKRVDALLRTTGIIQSLSFCEIKTHKTKVLKSVSNAYRADSWAISDELAGGIAQIQRTVQKSLMNISERLIILDEEGYQKQNSIYLYKPKAFLIIGSLDEFKNEKGFINESKFSSFELFRRSISDIEIITFDELYSRACALSNKQSKWI